MDFWNRLLGTTLTPKKPSKPANDPHTRLTRFKRVYTSIVELCNRPRDLASEGPLLDQLHGYLDRITIFLREETRAPVPHVCFQYAAGSHVYAAIARAATVSQYEPVIRSTISVFAALVDSEEEDFLAKEMFAKSLMRLVRKVVESGEVLITTETETAILELLFTIAAKIRLQPDILPVWFQSTARPELEDVFVQEKRSFVGITQKDDFPLCYLLIDRVHHEGRIGDFARTGLLYVFEATGRSTDLEEWVISSDLPTLMASGLGALYSQLSRELSILHADSELPAILAMSDYSTTHPRPTAESAFSERHKSHMTTFLSYLAFWQDVLDHCRSSDVKQTLLDHFQILFLQQLLYPSILQSSDTDAGSSVAVLTYMNSILDALEYPDLLHMILTYLLAIDEEHTTIISVPQTPIKAGMPPRSPTTVRRRQSLMLLNAPRNPDDAVDPNLFNLVDLVTNNVSSQNSQSVFAALKVVSTLTARHKRYAFGTLWKVTKSAASAAPRAVGALEQELSRYCELAAAMHKGHDFDIAFANLCEDMRYVIEAQISLLPDATSSTTTSSDHIGIYNIDDNDPLLRSIRSLLQTFLTNSIDVNLVLTQAIIGLAQCVEVRLDHWIARGTSSYRFAEETDQTRPWQSFMDDEENVQWSAVHQALRPPQWTNEASPLLLMELSALASELELVRSQVTNMDHLITARKIMLQASVTTDDMASHLPSMEISLDPQQAMLNVRPSLKGHSRSSSRSSAMQGNLSVKATNDPSSRASRSVVSSSAVSRTTSAAREHEQHASLAAPSIYKPPPPETPSTTDVLMQMISLPGRSSASVPAAGKATESESSAAEELTSETRSASLNHILTNVVILQEFILELLAVIQTRAAVLGDLEVRTK